MEQEKKIRVAITQGDTNGVGYEVILKVFQEPAILELCTPIIYGSSKIAAYHKKALNLETNLHIIHTAEEATDGRVNLLECTDADTKVDFGQPSDEAGHAALCALDRAMTDYRGSLYDVLVTAPINKATIQSPDFKFPGHTEYIETCLGEGRKALMILMNERLRVALVTTHLPVKDIAGAISKEAIIEKATIFHQALRRDFRISCPRIAVLALNPHAGDDGLLGNEEKDIILPAIEQLAESGIQAFGPYAADGFFGSGNFNYFDGVLAMYHDQGLAPFKTIALDDGVNYTAGLPIVRTSPDHGTAYDIAGQGKADENSLRQAIYTAIDIWRNRQVYDEPLQNPLPKLFHEKREDGNRARFAQPRPKDMFKKEKPGRPEGRPEGKPEGKPESRPEGRAEDKAETEAKS